MADETGGYVFRGEDGSLYLLRDEILEACKIKGPDLEYAQEQEGDVEGFMISTSGPFTTFARVNPLDGPTGARGTLAKDTSMCGW